jgi:hypothetical protein
MKITVQAHHPTHSQLARAGRFWPTAAPLEVDVLDQEEDPPEIEISLPNATTGAPMTVKRPDPVRIGKATLKILENDSRLSIKQLDGTSQRAADKAVSAAQAEVARLSAELVDVKARLARAEAEAEEAKADAANARAELEKLAAQVSAAAEAAPEGASKRKKG